MKEFRPRVAGVAALLIAMFAGLAAVVAPAATASPSPHLAAGSGARLSGTTYVTTAPGIAGTLLTAGVFPLPVPPTKFRVGFDHGLNVTYGFPITGGNPDLQDLTGDILHSGGINFVDLKGNRLEIGRFDISLDDATVYTREVNGDPGRIAVLDVNLDKLRVGHKNGATILTGIRLYLDPAAAGALNSTFGLQLPTDGSLLFANAKLVLRS